MKKTIKKIIAGSTGLMTRSDFDQLATGKRKADDSLMPRSVLDRRHISNLKMLANREELLTLLPKNARCAEIGVNEGEFSQHIFGITQPAELHLIDAWAEVRYHDGLRLGVEKIFEKEIPAKQVFLHHGYSTEVLPKMEDGFFDWVYLDTGHDYKLTRDELAILKTKVRKGGIISGHDYVMGNWVKEIRYGVMEAVHEFCLRENWEIIYLTINIPESPSFAIREIASGS